MKREYYFCSCRLDQKDCHIIWFSNDEDGVHLNSENKIVSFGNSESLTSYAEKQNLLIKDEMPAFYDFENLEKTLGNKKFEVDCVQFLNAWNLFDDISRSLGENFDPDHKITKEIYNKLFWGNNLPAVTPEGEWYEPDWKRKELEIIREVLLNGIAIFRRNLKYTDQ
jgi:hypothetical protein